MSDTSSPTLLKRIACAISPVVIVLGMCAAIVGLVGMFYLLSWALAAYRNLSANGTHAPPAEDFAVALCLAIILGLIAIFRRRLWKSIKGIASATGALLTSREFWGNAAGFIVFLIAYFALGFLLTYLVVWALQPLTAEVLWYNNPPGVLFLPMLWVLIAGAGGKGIALLWSKIDGRLLNFNDPSTMMAAAMPLIFLIVLGWVGMSNPWHWLLAFAMACAIPMAVLGWLYTCEENIFDKARKRLKRNAG